MWSLFPSRSVSMPVKRAPATFTATIRERTVASSWTRLFRDRVVGEVSATGIRLYRVRWYGHDPLEPEFNGELSADGTVLMGTFSMATSTKRRASWSLGILGLLAIENALTLGHRSRGSTAYWFLAGIAGPLLMLGLGLPWLHWYLGRKTIPRLTAILEEAAGTPAPNQRLELAGLTGQPSVDAALHEAKRWNQ